MYIIIVVSSNLAGRKQCNQGPYKKIEQSAKQTPNVGLSKSPICPVSWDFQHEPSFFLSIYLQKNSNDVAFSPLRWVRRRPSLPLSRFVMPCVWVCYAIDGRQWNSRGMCFSVLLPERLAGYMRLRWSCYNYQCNSLNKCIWHRAQDSLLKNAFIMKG